jgi:hypothetical protein
MPNQAQTTRCHKKPGEPCKIHNPIGSVAATERVEELFTENHTPKRNYTSVKTALNNAVQDPSIVNRYIPQDNDARFGTIFLQRSSRLGAAYLGLLEKARTGEHLEDLKEEYKESLRNAENELEKLEESYESGNVDDTLFRGSMLKAQMYHSAVLTAKDSTNAYRRDRYHVVYQNFDEEISSVAPTLEAAHKSSDALRESLSTPAIEGRLFRREGSRENNIGEIWDNSGRYTYRFLLKEVEWYIPLIRLKD